jgi:hypothetical protein
MLPESFIKEVESLKSQCPNREVHVRHVVFQDFHNEVIPIEETFKVTNVVLGPTGIELVCESL